MSRRRGSVRLVQYKSRPKGAARRSPSPELSTAEQASRREEALRPNPYLGYSHNALAAHLMRRGSYSLAESELRRAVYLNPFEARFKAHLAWCLQRMGRSEKARALIQEALAQAPENRYVVEFADLIAKSGDVASEGQSVDCVS